MSVEKPMNATVRKKKKQSEQRQLVLILIAFVLIIFSLGTLFGCFVYSVFAEKTIVEKVITTEPEEVQTETQSVTLSDYEIRSEGRTLDTELQQTIIEMCNKYSLPFALALAVAEQESGFDPDVISSTHDYGLMQINKINFEWLRKRGIEPIDRKGNIEAGVLILSEALKKYGDYGRALMAYNCGDTGAKRLWNKGIYSTQYSISTMERFQKWNSYIGSI